MKKSKMWRWVLAGGWVLALAAGSSVAVAQTLRVSVDQTGDFVLIGNTLGYDCANFGAAPIVGTVGSCGINTLDAAPDVYWRSDDQNGTAGANTALSVSQARATALLQLPEGATVTHAYLYWAGETTGQSNIVDDTVIFERPDGAGGTVFSVQVSAPVPDQNGLVVNTGQYFQAVADVSALVGLHGTGAYRVGGLGLVDFLNYDMEVSWASWSLIVFYTDLNEPLRQLSLYDGFSVVDSQTATAMLNGFLVPSAGIDGKLGVIAYDGDDSSTGDSLLFGQGTLTLADALSNGLNPSNNFFNSTRTRLGVADSIAGDLPRLAGTQDTMSGIDMDVIDITSLLVAGQTSAQIEATSSGDSYFIGAFITSISTSAPLDFADGFESGK